MRSIILAVCIPLAVSQLSVAAEKSKPSIRSGHNLLEDQTRDAEVAPGDAIGALAFNSTDGQSLYLAELVQRGPAAFVFLSTTCPLAKRYTTRLRNLHESYSEQGVRLVAIFPNSDETDQGIRSYAEKAGFAFPCVRDIQGYVAARLGATMTPQAFVIDRETVLRYRGAIDDNRYENRVENRYLDEALQALLSGTAIETPTQQALGCSIHLASATGEGKITYTQHVARILQDHCQSCHRPGQVAPFALQTFDDAVRWKTEIQAYTDSRLMPPWKAVKGVGHFSNDMSLTDEEIQQIARWVEGGTPEGNPEELPPSPKYSDDWAFGEPDLIVEMPEQYVVAAEGEDDYRHFVIPYEATEDKFVESIDVRPGNPNVVHHVIAYVDTSGKARKLDTEDDGPGYTRFGDTGFRPTSSLGGWAPGNFPLKTPKGTGRWLPKKCDIVLQVHYYRTGFEERDQTKIGVYFSKSERPVPTRTAVAINRKFIVPADNSNYEVLAETTIKQPSYLFAITPHMHLIGETMRVTAVLPDGNPLPLVQIDDWDFNWQTTYRYRKLHYLPAGTRIKLQATFDNSAGNPNNPNSPPKKVGWGEKTTDEMCIAFLAMIHESEYDPATKARRTE